MVEEGEVEEPQEEQGEQGEQGEQEASGEASEDSPEEKVQRTEVKLDIGLTESIKSLVGEIKSLKGEIEELNKEKVITPPAVAEKEKPKTELVDETKGVVSKGEDVSEEEQDSLVIEKADTGRGFQVYRDYSKLSDNKFKRLTR